MPFKTGMLKSYKVLFGAGKAAFVLPLALSVLIIPLTEFLALPVYVTLPILFFALLLPIAYVPLIYNMINNSPIVVFGRYHLPMFFSSVIGAIFGAVMFNIAPSSTLATKATLFLFSCLFSVFSIFIYSYAYNAITVRINEGYKKLFLSAQNAFMFLSMTAFCLCFLYFYNDGLLNAFGIIGYAVSSMMLIGAIIAYLASYKTIPKLVRVTLNAKRKLKEGYLRYYSPFAVRENYRTIICFALFCMAVSLMLLSLLSIVNLFELTTLLITLAILFFCFSYCIGVTVFSKKIYMSSFFIAAMIFVVAIILLVARTFFDYGGFSYFAVLLAMPLLGVGIGLIQNGLNSDFSLVAKRSNSSEGTILNIKNTIACVSFFLAICIYYLLSLLKEFAPVFRLSLCALLIISSFCTKFIKKKYLTLQFPLEGEHGTTEEELKASSIIQIEE